MSSEEVKKLPVRLSRGQRMAALLEDEDSADEEFWNQDFFQEEDKDQQYATESEEEDVVDTDFDASVSLFPSF